MNPAAGHCWKVFFLWVVLLQPGSCESSCDADTADRCYEDFLSSFSGILHQQSRLPPAALHSALEDLCGGLAELSQCRKDIVDGGCSDEQGRQRFDRWEAAFKAVERRACLDQPLLADIVRAHSCWSLDKFGFCVRTNTSLSTVRELLHTEFSQNECKVLYDGLNGCIHTGYSGCEAGKVDSKGTKTSLHTLLDVFLEETGCPVAAAARRSTSPPLAWLWILAAAIALVQRRMQRGLV